MSCTPRPRSSSWRTSFTCRTSAKCAPRTVEAPSSSSQSNFASCPAAASPSSMPPTPAKRPAARSRRRFRVRRFVIRMGSATKPSDSCRSYCALVSRTVSTSFAAILRPTDLLVAQHFHESQRRSRVPASVTVALRVGPLAGNPWSSAAIRSGADESSLRRVGASAENLGLRNDLQRLSHLKLEI